MSSGFEQPGAPAVSHELALDSCRRIITGYIGRHHHDLKRVTVLLDEMLTGHSPILALFLAQLIIDNLRRANQDKWFPVFNEAAADIASQVGDQMWRALGDAALPSWLKRRDA